MDDDFVSQLDLDRAIAAEIDNLTFEFEPDAASRVAERRKQALADLRQDPRYQAIAREFLQRPPGAAATAHRSCEEVAIERCQGALARA